MRRLSLIAALLLVLVTPLSSQAQSSPIVISHDPQGPPLETLPLKISDAATTVSTVVYVRYNSLPDQPKHLRLWAQLVDDGGQPLNAAAVAFTAQVPVSGSLTSAAVDATIAGFTLPLDSPVVRVNISITNLVMTGTFTGTLIAEVDNVPISGPQLIITRLSAPQIKFSNATDATGLHLSQPTAEFAHTLHLESTNLAPTRLHISVASLVGPDGELIAPSWSLNGRPPDTEIELPGLGEADLVMTTSLPLTGTYTGSISLIYNGQRVPTALAVTRIARPLPIDVNDIQTVNGELGLGAVGDVSMRFNLSETSGQTTTLYIPTLSSLGLVVSSQSVTQAKYDRVQFTNDQGTVLTEPWSIGGTASQEVHMTIVGLQGAGEYNGTVRIANADAQPIERSIKILVREAAGNAAAWITLGIILSSAIRLLSKVARPRLNKQIRLRLTLQQIETKSKELTGLTSAETAVLDRFATRVRSQYELATIGQDKDTDGFITEIDTKLPLWSDWVNLRRRIDAVQPPELQDRLRPSLIELDRQLTDPSTTDQLTALKTGLQKLDGDIGREVKAAFLKQVQDLQTELDRAKAPEKVKTALQAVKPLVDADKLVEARQAFAEVRRAYTQWLIDELEAKLNGQPPVNFDPNAWSRLKTDAAKPLAAARQALATDLDTAGKQYAAAYTLYMEAMLQHLRVRAGSLKAATEADTSLDAAAKQARVTKLADALQHVEGSATKLHSGDRYGAADEYELASTTLQEVKTAMGGAGGQLGGGRAVLEFAAALFGVPIENPAAENASTSIEQVKLALPSIATLTWQTVALELGLFVFTLVAAIGLGMKLLWLDAPTWGGWTAYVTALLWGLGLHKVTEQGFDGILSVREQIAGK